MAREGIVRHWKVGTPERHDRTGGLNKLNNRAGATVSARPVLKLRLQETVPELQIARINLPGRESYLCGRWCISRMGPAGLDLVGNLVHVFL